eukprot:GHVR01170667.1.p1 GENE.GHVR01170667.1~~GHVR01170667.1.p1  ORF type:complete len:284 (-),score=125.19 GHVR01170667.1:564-1415(-)
MHKHTHTHTHTHTHKPIPQVMEDFQNARHEIEGIKSMVTTLSGELAVLGATSNDLNLRLINHEEQLRQVQTSVIDSVDGSRGGGSMGGGSMGGGSMGGGSMGGGSRGGGSRGIPRVNDTEVGHEELDDIDKYLSNYVKSYPNLGVQIVKRDVGLYDINDHECNMIICPNDGPSVVSADKNIPLHEFVLLITDPDIVDEFVEECGGGDGVVSKGRERPPHIVQSVGGIDKKKSTKKAGAGTKGKKAASKGKKDKKKIDTKKKTTTKKTADKKKAVPKKKKITKK